MIEGAPWTKLPIKMDLTSCLKRQVLIEKFCFKKAKEMKMRNFFFSEISKCNLFEHSDYKYIVFYIKDNKILLEQDTVNKFFYIKDSAFYTNTVLSDRNVTSFAEDWLKDFMIFKGYRTLIMQGTHVQKLEDSINHHNI
jgi:hypothetical protein